MAVRVSILLGMFFGSIGSLAAQEPSLRLMLHGNMSHELPSEDYLEFVERARPDMLIMGVFDQRLYAAAFPSVPGKGKPVSVAAHLGKWKQVADRLHAKGIKLVGQMELFVVSDRPSEREQKTGWFGFYEKGWDDRWLGPRPAKSADELLETPDWDRHDPLTKKLDDAFALCGCRVNTRALRGCANKPAWRAVQQAMVKAALDIGVDGFITNRNYFEHCACSWCTAGFRRWLKDRYMPRELAAKLGIKDLATHDLCVVGTYRDHDKAPGPLLLEKLRFAKHSVKACFDEVYLQHARKLKPDVLLAQWNHMAYFDELHLDRGHLPPSTRTNLAHALANERWGLPADLWGKGESFFWYCNWGTTQNTILDQEYAGDTVLYGKLLRSQARGRPYVINKYDFYRPRVMMAEAAALGYVTNAVATPWQHEADRAVVLRYFDFLRNHAELYRSTKSLAEVALLFPQRAVLAGDASPLEYVEAVGRTLIRHHVLFDVLADDLVDESPLGRYRLVIAAAPEFLEPRERAALAKFAQQGGKVLWTRVDHADRVRPGAATGEAIKQAAAAEPLPFAVTNVEKARTDRAGFWQKFNDEIGSALSRFSAPWTVEVHAEHQPVQRRIVLHFVNYKHNEKAKGKAVCEREAPIAADPVEVDMVLPPQFQVQTLRFLSPDDDRISEPEFQQQGSRLTFRTPGFLVYGVCVLQGN